MCLVTGITSFSRLKAVHIFPRSHEEEVSYFTTDECNCLRTFVNWIRKGIPSLITDATMLPDLGDDSKIDSLQNTLTLRGDLNDAWGRYEPGVDADVRHPPVQFVV